MNSKRIAIGVVTVLGFMAAGWSLLSAAEPEATSPLLAPLPVSIDWPAHYDPRVWKTLDNTPTDNPTTEAGAQLGRALFYDTRLSTTQSTSCATCHQQDRAFTENRRVSVGHGGAVLDRNSMSLVDLRFNRGFFFWDERALTIEDAIRTALYSRQEMGHTKESVVAGVKADPQYKALFSTAFGNDAISEERIIHAIAQFVRTMTSTQSRYDQAAGDVKSTNDDFPAFSEIENRGKKLFIERCNLCHHVGEGSVVSFFGMFRTLNNGIDPNAAERDGGLGDVTFAPGDVGTFRSPSLKNVAVTGPYMHDGRMATLEEVMDHYATVPGVEPSSRFRYSAEDKQALIAFMKTLTDESFLKDPKFADPWKHPTRGTPPEAPMAGNARPAVPEPELTPSERIARGKGLRAGEAAVWLGTLDKNKDGAMDREEASAVIEVMLATGLQTLADDTGRGRRGGPPATRPVATAEQLALGDFNDDGDIDERETRIAAALRRQVELGDGGRLEVIMDRMLARWDLPVDPLVRVRAAIRQGKAKLASQIHAADLRTVESLKKTLSAEQWAKFQYAVIETNAPAPERALSDQERRAQATQNVMKFDKDEDQRLSKEEQASLARSLDRVGGGFGRRALDRTPGSLTRNFVGRMLRQYSPDPAAGRLAVHLLPERMASMAIDGDIDKDHFLSSAEMDAYIRKTAFDLVLKEGIYIGGGFADTLVNRVSVLPTLGLSPEQLTTATGLVEAHKQEIQGYTAQAMKDIFRDVAAAMK